MAINVFCDTILTSYYLTYGVKEVCVIKHGTFMDFVAYTEDNSMISQLRLLIELVAKHENDYITSFCYSYEDARQLVDDCVLQLDITNPQIYTALKFTPNDIYQSKSQCFIITGGQAIH